MAISPKLNKMIFIFISIILIFPAFLNCDGDLYRCPPNLPRDRFLRVHEDKCYRFVTSEGSWNAARDHCYRTGGALITINRRDIQLFVEGVLREIWHKNGMWIGAHDKDDEMDWKWVTGERVKSTYSNWDSGQPVCFLPDFLCHEDCACLRIDEGYKWHDYLCDSSPYRYGYACQYNMLPATTPQTTPPSLLLMTSPTTTAATTTEQPTTTTTSSTTVTTTTTTTEKTTIVKTSIEDKKITSELESMSRLNATNGRSLATPVNLMNVESQRLSTEESGMKTGGMVGLVVSFILVFIAGLVAGILICRRRYRKQYVETYSVGFNNVLYTGAPTHETHTRVKDTNIQAVGAADDSEEEEMDHKYVDIDNIAAGGATCVELPPCKDFKEPVRVACLKDNMYDIVQSNEEGESCDEMGGANGELAPPPPCTGVNRMPFSPEFLKKDTDVSQAYSNNLYGYHG